jgi:dTDP-4-amino-4,6-dideoxygalactose transaminase
MDDPELYRRACGFQLPVESASTVFGRTMAFWFWRRFRKHTLVLEIILERMFGERQETSSGMSGLSNLEAALLGTQMERLAETRRERVRNALMLVSILEPLGWKLISDLSPDAIPLKLILLLPPLGPDMRSVINGLGRAGLECQAGYPPCHWTAGYRDRQRVPITESIYGRVLCIPIERPLRNTGRLCRLVESWAKQPAGVNP